MVKTALDMLKRLQSAFWALPAPRKILYVGSVAVLAASLGYAFYLVNKRDYGTLYSGLDSADMGQVVQTLKAKKVPYKLTDGSTILVPTDQIYDVRLDLASQSIPKGGTTGFEIFDKQTLGSTRFVQKVNYQRALQGELVRTIDQLDEVLESRVHLVIPDESLFVEEEKPARAAVVLKLRPGAKLTQRQIQGIVHLVASSVQGLEDEGVSILSTDGQVLFKKNGDESGYSLSNFQMEYKTRIEEDLRNKLQSMLQQVLGSGKVITRVVADLDFSKSQITEETFDPDSAVVRSQQRSIETSQKGDDAARGNPDAPINIEGQLMQDSPPDSGTSKEFKRQRETVNYEVSRVNRQTVQTPGRIKKLSVAMIIDGRYEMKENTNKEMERVFVGRSSKELKALEDLAKKAVGFDEGRGDQISVSNIPFATDVLESGSTMAQNKWVKMVKDNQKPIINVVLVALVFFLVIRPLMKTLLHVAERGQDGSGDVSALPEGEHPEGALMLGAGGPNHTLSLKQQAAALVNQDTDRAAEIIRGWLTEGDK